MKRLAAAMGLLVVAFLVTGQAAASVAPHLADMEGGTFGEFSDTNAVNGTLNVTTERAFTGTHSAAATYDGSTDNGYARGLWHMDWRAGDDVWWGSAFYLPTGTMANVVDHLSLVRWDNFGRYGTDPGGDDKGGVGFHQGRGWQLTGGGMHLPIPDLPEGRWFTLTVHQLLAEDDTGITEVYVDGQRVAYTTGPNMARSPIDRLRVGIVAITSGQQDKPLTVYFDVSGDAEGGHVLPAFHDEQAP
jgi:hypothetical protein